MAAPERRRPRRGIGRSARFDDPESHGRDLEELASSITVRQLDRPKTLGVDPRLVLVLEFHSAIDSDEIHRNSMILLDGSDRHAIVAFADDPTLAVFHERLAAYRGPVPPDQKTPPHQAFFDAIVNIRVYGPEDRISDNLAASVAKLSESVLLRLDVQCWHPDDPELAATWLDDLRTAAIAAGGQVITTYQNDQIGLLLARVTLPSHKVGEFARLDVIASIDLLPGTELTPAEFHGISMDQLPEVARPARNAPVLGLIDSGVASAHPLLAGAILAAETLSPHIADGEDRHGHGTMVASLALHGPIPAAIRQSRLVPIARVVSVSVLDSGSHFPDDSLWEQDLAEAISYCAGQGARVINLSLGDPTRPFRPPRQPAVSAIVDHLARIHDLVIVTCTGNADPATYLESASEDPTRDYVADLARHRETGIIPPGTAALALTVGGITTAQAAGGYSSREPVERRPFGEPGWPSSITRRGPGVENAVKPELVAPSGTHGYQVGRIVRDTELSIIAARTGEPGRLLGADIGTSFAAPLVSRVALSVLARYPDFSSNLIRALVLLGAKRAWDGGELEVTGAAQSEAKRRQVVQDLLGYGEPTIERTLEVTSHRAVLVADGSIAMDAVHVYELPIPSSFYESGGRRYLDVAVAFDPPTRAQRLDYLGNKIEFYVARNIEIDELVSIFAKLAKQELETDDELTDDDEYTDETHDNGIGDSTQPRQPGINAALGSRLIKLDTSVSQRSRSANQRGSVTFAQRWDPSIGGGTFIVIRSVNRWCDDTLSQPYSLAVSLRRDQTQPEIYAELVAQLEAVIEVQPEIEIELES